MSDFEPIFRRYDKTDEPIPYEVESYISPNEREAIEFAGLFVQDDDEGLYEQMCEFLGLDPATQEEWTDEAAADYEHVHGHDPRNIMGRLERENDTDERLKQYLRELRGEQ